MQSKTKYALPIILATIFLDMLGIGILIPVIPLLLADPASAYYLLPAGWSIDGGYILLGFLTASYPLAQFLAAPILGQLSDRYGRKKVLILSLMGTCLSYLLFAIGIITRNIPLLFISRAFDGMTGGNIAVAQAAIADITEPQNRAKTYGLMGPVFGLGFIIGPFLGGVLSNPELISWFSAATPFWFAAILTSLNVFSVISFLPETHPNRNEKQKIDWSKSLHNILGAFRFPALKTLFGTTFLFSAGFSFFTTFYAVYLINRFNYSQGDIGNFFAYIGIWIVISQAVFTRLASKYFTEYQILRFSLIACGIMVLIHLVPRASWQLFLVVPIFAISNGLSVSNLTSLISRSADRSVQGEVMGINSSIQALAQALPPIVSGFIAARFSASVPTVVAGLLIIMGGLIFAVTYKNQAHAGVLKQRL